MSQKVEKVYDFLNPNIYTPPKKNGNTLSDLEGWPQLRIYWHGWVGGWVNEIQNKAEAQPAWLQLAAGAVAGAQLSLATFRDLKGFQGSLMDFNGFNGFKGVLRELNGFQGILSHSNGSKGILVDFNGFSGILRDFWDFKVFPEAFYFIFDFVKLCLYLFDFVLMTQLCTNFVLVFVPLIILARITLQSPTPTKPLSPPLWGSGGYWYPHMPKSVSKAPNIPILIPEQNKDKRRY